MTRFQRDVADQLHQAARQYNLDLTFEEVSVHATARFDWNGEERLLLVSDGELILEWDGEHYFEVPADPNHIEVRRFVEQFRLCLGGAAVDDARRLAMLYTGPAS